MITFLFKKIADNREPDSLASRLRKRRQALFMDLLESVPASPTILDVGGTFAFWKTLGIARESARIILLNRNSEPVYDARFHSISGDARDLSAFDDKSIDVIYSNSVIEHVGTFADQTRMANEIQRVSQRYFVQTPNVFFPIEPHFLFPLWQFLPISLRALLLNKFKLGWMKREPDPARAREIVESVRLLNLTEMKRLFPHASFHKETFCGMTKSIVAYGGW